MHDEKNFRAAARAAVSEISSLLASPKTVLHLTHIVDDFDERESYFSSSLGVVIRVLRSDETDDDSRPAYIQFFSFDGTHLKSVVKHNEPPGLFFLQFDPELRDSRVFKLRSKPSFVDNPNVSKFEQVVPISPLKHIGQIGEPLDTFELG